MTTPSQTPEGTDRFKQIGFAGLLGFVGALQFSIAVANIFFTVCFISDAWVRRI